MFLHATDYTFLFRTGPSVLVQFCHIPCMLTFVWSVTRFFAVNALYYNTLCFNCCLLVSVCMSSCRLLRATVPSKYVSHLHLFHVCVCRINFEIDIKLRPHRQISLPNVLRIYFKGCEPDVGTSDVLQYMFKVKR